MDRIDAVAIPETTEPDVHAVETSDQVRLLAQIANGLIAAHARIDVLEERLIDSTKGAVKSGVEGFAGESRDGIAQLQAKIGSWVVELGKTIDTRCSQTSNSATNAINSSTAAIKQSLTDVEQKLNKATEQGQAKTERQVSLFVDSVAKSFERLEERLNKAEQDQIQASKRERTVTLRWRLVFLLIGLALLAPQALQLYRFLMRGRG